MKLKTKSTVVFLIIFFSLNSCMSSILSTRENSTMASVKGMIYDMQKKQVAQANVELFPLNSDGKWGEPKKAQTDIHGRFAIPEVLYGKLLLKISKPGYEDFQYELFFTEASQVTYVQLISGEQLLNAAAVSLENQEWAKAKDQLDRSEKLLKSSASYIFLRAVLLNSTDKPAEAVKIIEDFLLGATGNYPQLLVYAGDIAHKKLNDNSKAKKFYSQALELRFDPVVKEKLDAIPSTN